MAYIYLFIIPFALSALLSYFLMRIGYRYKLLSYPRKRDTHKKPVPRIGGVAIFASFLLVSLGVYMASPSLLHFNVGDFLSIDRRMLGIWIGGLLVVLSMLYDDLKGLRAYQKLFIQILIGVVIIGFGVGIDYITNPFGGRIDLNSIYIPLFHFNGVQYSISLISDLLTLIWVVAMMNVINFVDGVDGLAAGVSVIASLTIALLSLTLISQLPTAVVSLILAGAIGGFLIWNFPPAKIFMGDSGSMFLGFMLGVLPIISGGKLATAFLVLGFPIVDGLFVALARLVKGQNPITTPDKTHLHHRFLDAGFSPRQAVISIYIISIAFAWVALRSTPLNKVYAFLALVALLLVLIFILSRIKKARVGSLGK